MNKKSKKRKGLNAPPTRCPYCGGSVVLKSADGIYKDNRRNAILYVCSHYPECDAYVRTHKGTKIPVGSMANQELRNLRKTAHHYFDQLYKSGYMTKDDAYYWLSSIIDAPMSKAHIGYLSEYYCKEVIEKSKEYLEVCRNKRKKADFRRGGAIAS